VSTGTLSPASPSGLLAVPAAAGTAVTRLVLRQVRRGGLIVVVLAAGMPAFVAGTYNRVMADPAAAKGPLAAVDWPAALVMSGIAAVLTSAGVIGYRRRDMHG
jgi:ABC-2 type transport system permease protein